MRKLTFKILSVLLILLLTLTNMVFIVSYMLGSVKTYAAMENLETQTNETNHQNVSFKAYFLEEPNKEVHSGELDINSAKDLYFQMEVKEKGYLKNAQVQLESIKGETNFIFSDSESNMIQELTDKNIKFKQINQGNIQTIQTSIKSDITETMDISQLDQMNKLVFSGVYIDAEGNENPIHKEIFLRVTYVQNTEVEIKEEIVKYVPYEIGEKKGTIIQTLVSSNIKGDKNLPVSETKLEIKVPNINELAPEKITVVPNQLNLTNENVEELEYTVENNKIMIQGENKEENGKIKLSNGENQYYITYFYPEKLENIEFSTEQHMEMKMYHVAETINKDFTGKYELKEKIGDIISSNIEATNIINKGKMYANIINGNQYETQYEVKWETNIISPEMANQIILEGTEEQFVKGNEEIATNSYFIETIIDAENAKSILGKTGRIEILNGDNIVETILLENSTEEEIKITYTEKYETLTFRTSEIIKEGNLKIAHKKGIQEITQTKESLKEIKEMATEVKTRMKVTGSEVVLETLSEKRIGLEETVTKAEITMDKNNLSTLIKNEDVKINVKLNNDVETSDLYKNPVFEIEMPEWIEDLTIKSANILFGEEIKNGNVDKIVREDGRIVLRVELYGEQQKFNSSQITGGTNILLNTDITVQKGIPSKQTEVVLKYYNENVVGYASGEEGMATYAIKLSSPQTFQNIATIKDFNQTGDSINSLEDEIGKLQVYREQKIATMEMTILNNLPDTCSEVVVLGRIPLAGNTSILTGEELGSNLDTILASGITISGGEATVYYSENQNATKDLNNVENGWKQDLELSKVKSYMLVITNPMESATAITASYTFQIPENLDYEQTTYGTFATYYKQEGIEEEQIIETKKMGLSTQESPTVEVTLSSSVGENTTVKERQVITYYVEVKNISTDEAISNLDLTLPIPEGSSYLVYNADEGEEVGEVGYEENDLISEITSHIDKLEPEEVRKLSYQVVVQKVKGQEIENRIKVELKDTGDIKYSNILTYSVEEAKLELRMLDNNKFETIVGKMNILTTNIINISNDSLAKVELRYQIPEGITLESGILYIEEGENERTEIKATIDEQTRTAIWNIENFNTTQVAYIRLNIVANTECEKSEIENRITAIVGGTEEYISNEVELLISKPDITISKESPTANQTIKPGDMVEYTIHIENNGEATSYWMEMEDRLPDELEFIKAEYTSPLGNHFEFDRIENNTLKVDIELEEKQKVDIHVQAKVKVPIMQNTLIENEAVLTGTVIGEIKSNKVIHAIEKSESEDSIYSINGIAWLDENKNGQREETEQRLKDIKVHLLEIGTGTVLQTVVTNENGEYEFNALSPKQYQILFEYDSKTYGVTEYRQDGVSELLNSDVVEIDYTENGVQKIGAATEVLTISDESLLYMDVGLIIRDTMDLKLEKTISKVTVQMSAGTNIYHFNNEKMAKVEIPTKYLEGANVLVEYKIRVENEGDIPAYVTNIVDYLPEGMTFPEELNPDWYQGQDGNLYIEALQDEMIRAGESKEITLTLSKIMTEENTGNVNNTAEIAETYNDYGLTDIDSIEGNQAQGEDDMSSADCVITPATGRTIWYIAFTVLMVGIFVTGVYLIKVKVYDKGGKRV